MKYTFPAGFSLSRAQELAALVNAAYNQLDQGAAWQPPANYKILAALSAKEIWKGIGPLAHIAAPFLPSVPFGFVAAKDTDLYVVIRGTKTPLEWLDDFTATPVAFNPNGQSWGKITRGFDAIYEYIGPEIIKALGDYKNGGGSLNSVFVTGHSLGAALAHIAAGGICAQFGNQPVSYTFSGPRAGEAQFAAAFAKAQLTTWRLFNTEDIVPTVPPAAIQMASPNMGMHGFTPMTQALSSFVQLSAVGYQHVGYPLAVTFHSDLVADNHNMDRLVQEAASA
jgi:triacylglycerol lipase